MDMEDSNFNHLSKHPVLNIESVNTDEGIRKLLNRETDLFISTRNINTNEYLETFDKHFVMGDIVICNDGVAVITGMKTGINKITTDELTAALMCGNQSLNVYLPPQNSGTFSFIKRRLLRGKMPVNGIITTSENNILQKVKEDPYAVGLISSNLLKENSDVKVLPVGVLRYDFTAYYYLPDKETLASDYPLFRGIYILANMNQRPLTFNFTKYLLSKSGKSIIAENNLFPSYYTDHPKQL
jgi:ABC-type phosphate transport system substrate-binding protein